MTPSPVSGLTPGSVPALTGPGVSRRKQSVNPTAHIGAGCPQTLTGSDWTDRFALAALAIFMAQALVWSLPG